MCDQERERGVDECSRVVVLLKKRETGIGGGLLHGVCGSIEQ